MTKAQRLFKKWKKHSCLPREAWLEANKELGVYLGVLANQGKLFSINANGYLCSVNPTQKNKQRDFVRIDDYVFAEMEIVNGALKLKGGAE